MSAVAVPVSPAPRVADAERRPTLPALTRLELRKMTDTRAGAWLLVSVLAVTLIVLVATVLTGSDDRHTLADVLGNVVQPSLLLLPVVGSLLVTSEWSQRTALTTFALVPDRGRVLTAKALAGLALALAAFGLCLALAAAGTLADGSSLEGTWSVDGGVLAQTALSLVLAMGIGVAFGAALLASAPSVVLYFVLPSAIGAASSLHALRDIGPWLDQTQSFDVLTSHAASATEWSHVATSALLWLVLPVVVGWRRVARSEIR